METNTTHRHRYTAVQTHVSLTWRHTHTHTHCILRSTSTGTTPTLLYTHNPFKELRIHTSSTNHIQNTHKRITHLPRPCITYKYTYRNTDAQANQRIRTHRHFTNTCTIHTRLQKTHYPTIAAHHTQAHVTQLSRQTPTKMRTDTHIS